MFIHAQINFRRDGWSGRTPEHEQYRNHVEDFHGWLVFCSPSVRSEFSSTSKTAAHFCPLDSEAVEYFDERLRPVLERTLGVPLFQEQLLKIAMVMANFSGSEAEELRRALSSHRSQERMDKVCVKLRAGLASNAVDVDEDGVGASAVAFASGTEGVRIAQDFNCWECDHTACHRFARTPKSSKMESYAVRRICVFHPGGGGRPISGNPIPSNRSSPMWEAPPLRKA